MNWLAHLALAAKAPPPRLLGNLAGDFLRGFDPAHLGSGVRAGIDDHRAVDRITDAHPAVRSVTDRLRPDLGRYAAVAVDVWFDHVLARQWPRWHPDEPITTLQSRVGDALEAHPSDVPPRLQRVGPRIVGEGWLASYAEAEGVSAALHGLARRARRRDNPLARAPAVLEAADSALEDAFVELFPLLRRWFDARLHNTSASRT